MPAQRDDGLCLAAAAVPSPTPVPDLAAILPSQTPNPSLPTSSTSAALGELIWHQPGLFTHVCEEASRLKQVQITFNLFSSYYLQ